MIDIPFGQQLSIIVGDREVQFQRQLQEEYVLSRLRLELNQRYATDMLIFWRNSWSESRIKLCNGVCEIPGVLTGYYEELNFASFGTTACVISNGMESVLCRLPSVHDMGVLAAQLGQ